MKDTHKCIVPKKAERSAYGHAVESFFINDDKLFADNGEYCTQINYCPFCGEKATVQIEEAK